MAVIEKRVSRDGSVSYRVKVRLRGYGYSSDSLLKVDIDGVGTTYVMTQIATIEGVTGLIDEVSLAVNGNLIAS